MSDEVSLERDAVERLQNPTTAIEALAAVWASIDGKLHLYGVGRHAQTAEEAFVEFGGYYEGYLAEAEEAILRLEKRGFTIEAAATIASLNHSLEERATKPNLLDDVLNYLRDLKPGWDGYNGITPTDAALATADNMDIIPGGDGSVQFELHAGGCEVEIWIGPDGKVGSVYTDLPSLESEQAKDEIARLKHSLDTVREEERWQTIDSAPKDGTPVLLLSREQTVGDGFEVIVHRPRAHIGKWDPEGDAWVDELGGFEGEICTLAVTGVWLSGGGWFQPNEVTHWRPLPPPPDQSIRKAVALPSDADIGDGANKDRQQP